MCHQQTPSLATVEFTKDWFVAKDLTRPPDAALAQSSPCREDSSYSASTMDDFHDVPLSAPPTVALGGSAQSDQSHVDFTHRQSAPAALHRSPRGSYDDYDVAYRPRRN